MAALSTTLPTVPPPLPQVHRTDSMGSNVSAGSVASLSRRPRTKGRPRAITVSSRRDRSPVSPREFEAPHATGDEMFAEASFYPTTTMSTDPSPSGAPSRPPRSPLRAATLPKDGLSHPDIVPGLGWKAVDDMESSWRSRAVKIEDSTAKRRKRGSSVPRDAFRLSMLSSASSAQTNAFFTTLGEMQTVPHFTSLREARQRLRESNLTMQSGTTSSVYPLSSSTVSGTESPCSPRSIADSFQDNHISSVDPDEPYDDYQAFNTDDVSYRLRLLVSNNYFLPPAHSKPSPSAFASPVTAPSKKGPAFLDIFRVGKARSKPTTLTGPVAPELGPPRLRTTADSTITSSRVASTRAAPVPRGPVAPTLVAQTSRVAVVREKVDNLMLAAEQAEQELKMRVDAKQNSTEHFDDYVDPTDAVDLPPPSENSPFPFQASALRGLGVENSLGAAVLAERLPPGSPGVWSLDPDEEAWRKALLHEAVGHSLNNTPANSFHTSSHVATPSSGSMEPSFTRSSPTPAPRASTPGVKRNLGQRIVEILEEQHEALVPQSLSPQDAVPPTQSQLRERDTSPMSHSSQLPLRAESPAEPQTVLPPPPRPPAKLLRSSTSTDSPGESQRMSQMSSASTLRKTSSSPMLHLWHEPTARRSRAVVSMTPPLLPRGRASSVATPSGPFTPRDSMTSGSHYSVQDPESIDHVAEPDPISTRPSFSSLLSRPSVSEYSQISPTVSAFNDGHFGPASSNHESIPPDTSSDFEDIGGSRDPESIRHLSPPPRASSSIAIHSLHPPPRFPVSREPSPTLIVAQLQSLASYPSNSSSDPSDSSERLSAYATVAEQSDSPSPYLREHRTGAVDALSTLPLSSLSISSSIHSAPPPASPLEFFDQIDCNVMDDWETSDESDGDVDAESTEFTTAAGRSTPHGSSQGHSSVLHAPRMTTTPSVSPAVSRDDLSVNSGSQERSPIVNVPRPPIYFKDTMGDQGLSSYDLYQMSRSAAASSSSRVSEDTQARGGSVEDKNYVRKEGRTASMQRLDGLMLQHIEAERGTMSRIAKTVKDAHS